MRDLSFSLDFYNVFKEYKIQDFTDFSAKDILSYEYLHTICEKKSSVDFWI